VLEHDELSEARPPARLLVLEGFRDLIEHF
jgi:hypothetical protein